MRLLIILLIFIVGLNATEYKTVNKVQKEKQVFEEKPDKKNTSQYLRKNTQEKVSVEDNRGITLVVFSIIVILSLFWFLFKRKINFKSISSHKKIANFERLYVDIHSHIVPGIDDGAKSIEESLSLVKRFKELGYTKLIMTPHTMMHRYQNTTKSITEAFTLLKQALKENNIDIKIEVASEYFLDEHLMELIANKDVLTFGDNYLLFEMSYISHPVNYEAMINIMTEAGYKPVLAHPERYIYLGKNFSKYASLRALGVYFQLNVNSIGGYYSDEVKEIALKLIDNGMIDFLGSDTHKSRHLDTFSKLIVSREYQNIFDKNNILNNTL